MKIDVLTFGMVKEITGKATLSIETDGEITVDGLKDKIEQMYPQITSYAVAVNREYADGEAMIRQGDEVALIPPVSGG